MESELHLRSCRRDLLELDPDDAKDAKMTLNGPEESWESAKLGIWLYHACAGR
jgi:hypothetical protein